MISMSGIDEQKIKCPFCKKEPEFWICDCDYGRSWLLSDRYLAAKSIFSRHVIFERKLESRNLALDSIEAVSCKCRHEAYPPGSGIYEKVLRKMKDFRAKEGINFNNGGTGQ